MSVLLKRAVQEVKMLEKMITPGDKVEMTASEKVILPDGTEGTSRYMTIVTDVSEDNILEIAMPMEKTKLVLLPVDGEYHVCFFTNAGMYTGTVKIIDRQKRESTYVLIAELISELTKSQRREYYRLNCVIEMVTKQIGENEAQTVGKNLGHLVSQEAFNKGVIVDISGGGLRFVAKQQFEPGTYLYLKFSLPIENEEREFSLAAKVVTSGRVGKQPGEYENRVKFLYLENTVREEIIKYIFDEERKNRKNGKR